MGMVTTIGLDVVEAIVRLPTLNRLADPGVTAIHFCHDCAARRECVSQRGYATDTTSAR